MTNMNRDNRKPTAAETLAACGSALTRSCDYCGRGEGPMRPGCVMVDAA